jgi:hypothetical protein
MIKWARASTTPRVNTRAPKTHRGLSGYAEDGRGEECHEEEDHGLRRAGPQRTGATDDVGFDRDGDEQQTEQRRGTAADDDREVCPSFQAATSVIAVCQLHSTFALGDVGGR